MYPQPTTPAPRAVRRRVAQVVLAVSLAVAALGGVAWFLTSYEAPEVPAAVRAEGGDSTRPGPGAVSDAAGGDVLGSGVGGRDTGGGAGGGTGSGTTVAPPGAGAGALPALPPSGGGVDWTPEGGSAPVLRREGAATPGGGGGDPGGRFVGPAVPDESDAEIKFRPEDSPEGPPQSSRGVPEGPPVDSGWAATCIRRGETAWEFRWNLYFVNGAVVTRAVVIEGGEEGAVERDAQYGALPRTLSFSTTASSCSAM